MGMKLNLIKARILEDPNKLKILLAKKGQWKRNFKLGRSSANLTFEKIDQ
jgi:hypothetical protein